MKLTWWKGQHRKSSQVVRQLILVFALLFPLLQAGAVPVLTAENRAAAALMPQQKAGQELLQLAAQYPQSQIQVIVQKSIPGAEIEQWVADHAGEVTQDLSIINAFAAELAAGDVPALAELDGVRWISLDGPVTSSATSRQIYYLLNSAAQGDTASQAILPINNTVPTAPILYNYDLDRDQVPGLTLLPGGNPNSSAQSGQIQRWQMEPFQSDMVVQGSLSLRLYVAVKDFQRNAASKLTAHLIRIGSDGRQAGVLASKSVNRTWGSKWTQTALKFPLQGFSFSAGERLEIAITVDGPETMWLAFGSHKYPAQLNGTIQDVLLTSSVFYLGNEPVLVSGDTPSHSLLPFAYAAPRQHALVNYDTDRDSEPGLLLTRGATSLVAASGSQIQRWQLPTFASDTQLAPNSEVEVYAAVNGMQRNQFAKLWAYLNEVDGNGNLVETIASASYQNNDWGKNFAPRKLAFKNPITVVAAGNHLELALMVDNSSVADLVLAYNTKAYASSMTAIFWPLIAYTLLDTIDAPEVWAQGYQGQGVRVAVIDSGIWEYTPDLAVPGTNRTGGDDDDDDDENMIKPKRLIKSFGISSAADKFGHGTFVASMIAGNGASSGGYYVGVAPQADIINVRVSDEWGGASESNVVAGIQWVLQNKAAYNIRVVNMSLNSTTEQPYGLSPLNAAAEILWFNGVVVVVSGGNNGAVSPGKVFSPANDPFVIAVGSTDERQTGNPTDDLIPSFSAFGITQEGYARPDVVAPGSYIVSTLADHSNFQRVDTDNHVSAMDKQGKVKIRQFVASGTSISAGAVSGAAALLLQAMPGLNPDQVKYLLMVSATAVNDNSGAGAGQINIANAIAVGKSFGNIAAIPAANNGVPDQPVALHG